MAILTGSQLMLNIGFSQMVPVMPLFAAQMGSHWGSFGVGLVISAPSMATVLLSVPLGRLCDSWGRKPLMYVGTALTAVGTLLTPFTGGLATLIPTRLIVGAGMCSSQTGSSAYMADLTDHAPQHRAKIMGINQAVAGSVWVVGPAVGGWLAETYGMQNSFIIAGAGAALCSLGYAQLPETLQQGARLGAAPGARAPKGVRGHLKAWWHDVRPLVHDRNQQAMIALCVPPTLRWACFTSVVALHAASVVGAGPAQIGLMFTSLALSQGAAMPLGSWLADKWDGPRKSLVIPAGLAQAASFGALAFATDMNHFLAAMAVQGCASAFIQPAQGAFMAEVTPQDKRGQAMSLQRQVQSLVGLFGPATLGLLADLTSSETSILLSGGIMAVCNLSYLVMARNVSAKPQPAAWPRT